jgi:hypothetical protein
MPGSFLAGKARPVGGELQFFKAELSVSKASPQNLLLLLIFFSESVHFDLDLKVFIEKGRGIITLTPALSVKGKWIFTLTSVLSPQGRGRLRWGLNRLPFRR